MKKIAVIFAALLSTGAMAENYVSGGVGVGYINQDCAGTDSCDNTNTAFKLIGGYGVTKDISVELGYISFGKAKASGYLISVGNLTSEIKSSAITLGGALHLPVSSAMNFDLRLGLASVKSELSGRALDLGFNVNAGSETKVKPYFGVGVIIPINKSLAVEACGDFSQASFGGDSASVRAMTVGLRGSF